MLPPGNAGGGSKGSTIIRAKVIKKCYHRGTPGAEVKGILSPGNAGGGSKGNTIIKTKVIKKYYYRGNIINESYKVLLPRDKRNIIIRGTP